MKSIFLPSGLVFLTVVFCNCNSHQSTPTAPADSTTTVKSANKQLDSLFPKESYNLEDTVTTATASDTIKTIRGNFKRINSISNWTKKETRPTEQTTEGGEATYYYLNGKLEKIVTQNYGETFQQLSEYYLLEGNLSFVFEKTLKYNRPMYYDSTAMKDNNDTETFDLKKATTAEARSYFFNGHLLSQINQPKDGSGAEHSNLKEEEQRLKGSFDELMKQLSKK